MTNKDFKEGMEVSFNYGGKEVIANLSEFGGRGNLQNGWLCVNLPSEWKEGYCGVTNLQPKLRTIDDLECGDYVVDGQQRRKCIGVLGELYFISTNTYDGFSYLATLKQLKDNDITLYQPEEVKEDLEKELFDMIYAGGKVGVVVDEKCNAFKDLINKIKIK